MYTMQANYYILIVNKQQNEVLTEYNCSVCSKKFLSDNELLTHCKIIHRPLTTNFDNNTDCAYCETCEMLYEEGSYTDHFPCNAVDIRCFFCLTTMPLKSHFSSHNLTYHSWRKFQCNLCETDTKEMTFAELNEHMRLHNEFGCGVYQCVNCDLFMEKSALSGHVEQCLPGCRCFNMNEICVCDRFNEAFYITKILLADIVLKLHKTSNKTYTTSGYDFPDEDWTVEFGDEKSLDNTSKELRKEDISIIPTLLLEVDSEPELTFLEDDEPENTYLENNGTENSDDQIDIKNPDIQNISAEFSFENYKEILSNLKTEDSIFEEEESHLSPENIEPLISNFTSEQDENSVTSLHDIEELSESELITYFQNSNLDEKSSEESSHEIEELSESEILSYLKSEQVNTHSENNQQTAEKNSQKSSCDIERISESVIISFLKSEQEHNRKRETKRKYNKKLISKKQKKCKSSEVKCVVCGLKFENELELDYHGVIHHRPWALEILNDIFCARCKSWFDSEDEYQTHHPCSKEPATNRCQICNMQFPFKEHFLLHNVNFITPRRYNCLLCENSSNEFQLYQLNKHRKTEHNKNGVFECLKCEVNFERSCDLKRHLIVSCSNNEVDTIAETYKLKINDKTLPDHFNCEICNKIFVSKISLKQHKSIHDHGGIKLCFICGQTCGKNNYKDHMNIHLKTKVYECSLCNKKFYQKKYLRQHEKIHRENKNFPCNFCSKTFTQQTSLIYHMAGHTKENVFVCSVCGEKWDTQRKLTSHMDVHNADGTNPHKCHVCLKYFTHKCNLLVHMRMHAETSKDK